MFDLNKYLQINLYNSVLTAEWERQMKKHQPVAEWLVEFELAGWDSLLMERINKRNARCIITAFTHKAYVLKFSTSIRAEHF